MERISEQTKKRLLFLVGRMFECNRYADRGMSLLETRWKMLTSAKYLHGLVAHAMLVLADYIGEYLSSKNCEVIYPATLIGDQEYSSPLEFFNFMLEEFYKVEDEIEDIIDGVIAEKDNSSRNFLDGFLSKWQGYVITMQNVSEIANLYGSDSKSLQQFDDEIGNSITVGDISYHEEIVVEKD